ncbi:hypothetical protein RIR_jg38397.t1 [Rhizophagus irregularis DAOM 181602=DAOM 197198]|nr:hypothetical protein RIR_jg38397.t1 [Rhizophagus irregularis DAOM 181602=DAOM 197198]
MEKKRKKVVSADWNSFWISCTYRTLKGHWVFCTRQTLKGFQIFYAGIFVHAGLLKGRQDFVHTGLLKEHNLNLIIFYLVWLILKSTKDSNDINYIGIGSRFIFSVISVLRSFSPSGSAIKFF